MEIHQETKRKFEDDELEKASKKTRAKSEKKSKDESKKTNSSPTSQISNRGNGWTEEEEKLICFVLAKGRSICKKSKVAFFFPIIVGF